MNFKLIHKAAIQILSEAKGEMRQISPLKLRSYDDEDSGFCRHNPLINQYARESPEQLAEVLIFVVATQLVRWPDVVSKFPNLMNFIYANNGMFRQGEKRSEEALPKTFASIVVGKTDAIDFMWKNRSGIFSMLSPYIEEYHNSGAAKKEEAAFKLYLKLLQMPRLGLPKAGFAAQLIIGRLGCIDSINSNILELPQDIMTTDKEGATRFKTPGKQDKPTEDFVASLTKGGVELAKKYADYLSQLEKLSSDNITKILWDNWCDIVAYKIKNPRTRFGVELQGGLTGGEVESDYPRQYGAGNPSGEFMKRYASNIAGTDVSLQHYPPALKAALKEAKMNKLRQIIKEEIAKALQEEKELTASQKKLAAKYPPKDKITRGDIIAAAKEKKKDGKKPEEEADLEEASTMAGGAVAGGPTKPAFGAATQKMREKPQKLKGTPLAEMIKKKIAEKLKTKDIYARTVGLGSAGTGATGLEEELDEGVEIEYLTEAEAKKKQPRLGKVTRNPSGSKKKFHVYVKCSGKVKKISFGDPGLSIKRDSPERRKSFRARHKCDKPEGKNRCTARYWACMTWRRGTSVSSMTKEEE